MNRGVGIIYEPGSVFKPIMGSAGLMEKIITPDTPFHDEGSIDVGGRRIRNWDGRGLGNIKFEDIIKFSVNTGMASLGLKLGGEKETEYAKRFGFGEATGTDVPGEEVGILYNPKDMVPSDVATMGIGQGIAVTPLQMLRAICAIANGGNLVRPYVVKKVTGPDGKVIKENKTQVDRQVITPEVASQMRAMMEKVVSEGGGKSAQIKGYKIAGKTGTAEKLSPKGGYIPGVYIASFVGFVPSDNPRYAMIIMIDSPRVPIMGHRSQRRFSATRCSRSLWLKASSRAIRLILRPWIPLRKRMEERKEPCLVLLPVGKRQFACPTSPAGPCGRRWRSFKRAGFSSCPLAAESASSNPRRQGRPSMKGML